MFANVIVRAPATAGAVRVPQEAVLHSGERSIVIVEKSRGLFEPREVTLGPSGGGYQEIRSGVQPGETVVTSSQFLIDSESNLKAAISQMMDRRPDEGPSEAPPPVHQH
jgi:Cu(I)/Ag(I) efflux system membrane fusion protein